MIVDIPNGYFLFSCLSCTLTYILYSLPTWAVPGPTVYPLLFTCLSCTLTYILNYLPAWAVPWHILFILYLLELYPDLYYLLFTCLSCTLTLWYSAQTVLESWSCLAVSPPDSSARCSRFSYRMGSNPTAYSLGGVGKKFSQLMLF